MVDRSNRFLEACWGRPVDMPPVWMMRQAGRYLPGFQEVRKKVDFLGLCRTPELVTEVTLEPVTDVGVDAAIIFSDILVLPEAMGMELVFDGDGPRFPHPLRDEKDVAKLTLPDPREKTAYLLEGLKLTRQALNGRVPLIGFAGAPFTLMCYMVDGKGSAHTNFDVTRQMLFSRPDLAHQILEKLTQALIPFLKAQVEAGAQCLQLFDSSAGLLSPEEFETFAAPYAARVLKGLADAGVPRIYFVLGGGTQLRTIQDCGPEVVGLDWHVSLEKARNELGPTQPVQGNLDPYALLGELPELRKRVDNMLRQNRGRPGHIVNLGHGILRTTKPEHARAFVDMVHAWGSGAGKG